MKILKIVSAILLVAMLFAFPVFAAGEEGIDFKADVKYVAAKAYDKAPVTFEAWVNIPTTVTGRAGVILGSYGAGTDNISFEISDNGVPRFYANSGAIDAKFTGVHINTGNWVHLAMVYKAAQSSVLCYVDGELVETKTVTFNSPLDITTKMCLGGDHRGGNEQYFKGKILSAAVYSDERTDAEIKSDMDNYGTDGLIASYDTSTLSSFKIVDGSGNGYDMIQKTVWVEESELDDLPEFAYSFAVVGDTQRIAYNYKGRFGEIYDWILDTADTNKTKFVMGLGDITETSSNEEWTVAMDAIKKLDGKIPYSLVRGNHDSVASFNEHVKMDNYKNVIAGSYDGTMLNTYQKFSVGDVKYMVFTLDYGASNSVLAWAKKIINDNPDHNVIITTHAYLFRDGTTLDADDECPPATTGGKNNGDHIWDKLVSQCENIVLVLSGHDPCDSIIMTQEKGVHGNTVTQMLIDPQGADNTYGGLGAVAMFYFSEDGKDVTVRYYSTLQEKYFMSDSQFTMTLDVVGDEDNDGNDDNNTQNNGATQKPENTDATEAPAESGSDTAEVEEDGGCGSALSVSAIGAVAFITLGVCLLPKKKENE